MKNTLIVDFAAKEIGYVETPAGSNMTKYGKWFGYNGVSWCGIFVSWCYANAGVPLLGLGYSKGFAGCQTAVAFFKKNKRITKNPQMGDIVFFYWKVKGKYDHTGIFVKKIDETTFETIEGNTSVGNNSNGGGVMRRTRTYADNVLFVHPKVLDSGL